METLSEDLKQSKKETKLLNEKLIENLNQVNTLQNVCNDLKAAVDFLTKRIGSDMTSQSINNFKESKERMSRRKNKPAENLNQERNLTSR